LNNIKANEWANSEIVHIMRNLNTEAAGAHEARKSQREVPRSGKWNVRVEHGWG
jgi:hypothetical protein